MDAMQHRERAEKLLSNALTAIDQATANTYREVVEAVALSLRAAQVHATLAATAANIVPPRDIPKLFGEDGNEDL